MKKPDEIAFLRAVYQERKNGWTEKMGDEIAAELGIAPKRAYFLLNKWSERHDWWEYGVSARTGWLTDKGLAEIPLIIKENPNAG